MVKGKDLVPFIPPTEEEIMLIQPNNVTFGQYNISEWQENLLTLISDKIQKHMTREEELQQAVVNFSEAHKYEEGLDYCSLGIAFEEGAEWADLHPDLTALWHDASEMPKEGEWILIQFDEDSYDALVFCDMNAAAFCTCCKKYGSTRWAYISDLLPKGGER